MLGTLSAEDIVDWKSHIAAMTRAYNCTKNASTNFSPYFLMFSRHPRLPIDVAFGLHRTGSNVAFSKSSYVDRLKKGLEYAYDKARSFSKKRLEEVKPGIKGKQIFFSLEPDDVVLVRKMTHTGKHKIQNSWEDDEYVIVTQPNSDIPVYIVQPISGGKQKTLHKNLLLPLSYKVDENVENVGSDEEIEMVSPLFEFKGNSERVNKTIKVDQVDKSTEQVSNHLIDLHDSAVVPISKGSSNDPEQNVQNSLLESFDSEDEIIVSPASVQNKSPKMEMSNLPESLHITEMIGAS